MESYRYFGNFLATDNPAEGPKLLGKSGKYPNRNKGDLTDYPWVCRLCWELN